MSTITRRQVGSIAVLFLLCSCASSPTRPLIFSPGGATGLAAGSITFESGAGEYQVLLSSGFGMTPIFLSVGDGSPIVPFATTNPALKAKGNVFVRDLAAGRYVITGWRVLRNGSTSASTVRSAVEFEVVPGKLTYLGNLHFDSQWSLSLRDAAARDLPVLRSAHPELAAAEVQRAFPPEVSMSGIGGSDYTTSRVPIPIPVFVPR